MSCSVTVSFSFLIVSVVERCVSIRVLTLEVDVTSHIMELLCDSFMLMTDSDVENRAPILVLKIDVTGNSTNQLLGDSLMPFIGREVDRSEPNLVLKIDVTEIINQLCHDGSMPICGCGV